MAKMKDGRYTVGSLCKCRHTRRKHLGDSGSCLKCACLTFDYDKNYKKVVKTGQGVKNG